MNRSQTKTPPCWDGRRLDAVLFDLDGTLVDTADDIALALNRALAERRIEPIGRARVREMIGRGAPTLVARAREARKVDASTQEFLLERFSFHYDRLQSGGEASSVAYPGVTDGLAALHDSGLRLAVVTNKQQRFAIRLLQRLGLAKWIATVVGGDSCERRKPDPQPLLFACDALHVDPAHALMVGDSKNDVEAARAAGLPMVCVPYGYNECEDPRELSCDVFVESLAELPQLLLPPHGAAAARAYIRLA